MAPLPVEGLLTFRLHLSLSLQGFVTCYHACSPLSHTTTARRRPSTLLVLAESATRVCRECGESAPSVARVRRERSADMPHIRQPRSDSGVAFQSKSKKSSSHLLSGHSTEAPLTSFPLGSEAAVDTLLGTLPAQHHARRFGGLFISQFSRSFGKPGLIPATKIDKRLQERANGSKNGPGMTPRRAFCGPGGNDQLSTHYNLIR